MSARGALRSHSGRKRISACLAALVVGERAGLGNSCGLTLRREEASPIQFFLRYSIIREEIYGWTRVHDPG
jgi:hypothetical protein